MTLTKGVAWDFGRADEFYWCTIVGMSEHLRALPILPVHDIVEAVAFWSRLPSLNVDEYEDGGHAFVLHGEFEVVRLALFPDLDVTGNHAGC